MGHERRTRSSLHRKQLRNICSSLSVGAKYSYTEPQLCVRDSGVDSDERKTLPILLLFTEIGHDRRDDNWFKLRIDGAIAVCWQRLCISS